MTTDGKTHQVDDLQVVYNLRGQVLQGVAGGVRDEADGHFGFPVQALVCYLFCFVLVGVDMGSGVGVFGERGYT